MRAGGGEGVGEAHPRHRDLLDLPLPLFDLVLVHVRRWQCTLVLWVPARLRAAVLRVRPARAQRGLALRTVPVLPLLPPLLYA